MVVCVIKQNETIMDTVLFCFGILSTIGIELAWLK